jgi:hypothetical protein
LSYRPTAAAAPDYRIRPAPLLPEGSFLPRRRGTLVRSGSGELVYVFHPDETGRSERPMTLLPSAVLERMEEVVERRRSAGGVGAGGEGSSPQFLLTGQVFVYNRTNYLLPTAFSLASPAREEGSGAREAPTGEGDLDSAIEELIEQIQAERPGARALGESSMLADATRAGEDRPEAAARARPDGTLLVRQRGRLTRQAGAWRFTIDNDSDGSDEFQPTMTLLPCLNLQRMEALAADRGENQAFEVSGMVLEYRGRNYLVPTIYRVVRGGDVRPLQ